MSRQHYTAESYRARDSVGYLVKRAYALCLDSLEPAFAARGFTYVQFGVLMSLRDNIAVNPKDLCTHLRHDSGALTRVLDQLEERGWLERRRSTEDRRAIELHLTAAGRAAIESLVPVVVDKLNFALRDFSQGEVSELIRLLHKFIDNDAAGEPAGAKP